MTLQDIYTAITSADIDADELRPTDTTVLVRLPDGREWGRVYWDPTVRYARLIGVRWRGSRHRVELDAALVPIFLGKSVQAAQADVGGLSRLQRLRSGSI